MHTNATTDRDLWLEKISNALRNLRKAGLLASEDASGGRGDRPSSHEVTSHRGRE